MHSSMLLGVRKDINTLQKMNEREQKDKKERSESGERETERERERERERDMLFTIRNRLRTNQIYLYHLKNGLQIFLFLSNFSF